MKIEERILNQIERKLIIEGKSWEDGTSVKLMLNDDERKEFLLSDYFDNGFSWEFSDQYDGLYELSISI